MKVKFADYSQVTRGMTRAIGFTDVRSIQESSQRLLDELDRNGKSVRLLGLGIGNFIAEDEDFQQLTSMI